MKKIITIGRELGSGGRTIGKTVANKLGIPYYDRELIDEAASKLGLSTGFVETTEQKVTNSLLYNIAVGTSYGRGILESANNQTLPLSEQVYIAQKEVIKNFADKGSCVIVGRCADRILSDRDDVLKVFIYADKNKRAERAVKEYGFPAASAIKQIEQSDKERKRHYNCFTEKVWGDRQNYDLLLNSGELGIDACVEIICKLVNENK